MGEEHSGEVGEEAEEEQAAAMGSSSLSDDCLRSGSRRAERPRPMGERRRGLRATGEVVGEEGEGWVPAAGGEVEEGEVGAVGEAKVMEGGREEGEGLP